MEAPSPTSRFRSRTRWSWLSRLGLAVLVVLGMLASGTARPLRAEGTVDPEIELTVEHGEDSEPPENHPTVTRLARSTIELGRGSARAAARRLRPPSQLPSTAPMPPPRRPWLLPRSGGDDDDDDAIG